MGAVELDIPDRAATLLKITYTHISKCNYRSNLSLKGIIFVSDDNSRYICESQIVEEQKYPDPSIRFYIFYSGYHIIVVSIERLFTHEMQLCTCSGVGFDFGNRRADIPNLIKRKTGLIDSLITSLVTTADFVSTPY